MQYLDDEFEKSLPPMGHPLRKLGVRLTELLDEDQWAECDRLLLEGWEHDAADRAAGARELFTADQLAAAVAAERERCAQLCERMKRECYTGWEESMLQDCADAIRSGK